MKTTLINYEATRGPVASIHRAGCGDIAKNVNRNFGRTTDYGSLQEAVDDYLGGDLVALGYRLHDLKLHNCLGSERNSLIDPADVQRCPGCGETYREAKRKYGCGLDDGCLKR